MNPVDMIARKRDGYALTTDEIEAFVRGTTDQSFKDYQLSAMLMAIYLRGMDARETVDLTMAMARSGDMLDLGAIDGVKVDKHSTGGVGDTTTLILAPLVAACGAKVAKMSGRGLGHTGGTLDKLEAIPGLSVSLTQAQFIRQVTDIGLAVIGQTAALAPADKTLYALRDVTATVGCLPLIVSSILSKKIASGADVVVLDVKTGSGALMPTLDQSLALARAMVDIGNRTGRKFSALVTDMDQPLGLKIGNALEVSEAIEVLAGVTQGPLREVSLALGAQMLLGAGIVSNAQAGVQMLLDKLQSGAGLEKLSQMIAHQGGDARVVEDTRRLPTALTREMCRAPRAGYVARMYTDAIGNAARVLGAGRIRKEDAIDPAVGLVMQVRLGDYVHAGDPLCEMHLGARSNADAARLALSGAIVLSDEPPAQDKLIYGVISGKDAP
ncbi:MAG: thymidine phosphorylase [Clostridia bacterium]